jgi:hypothetical protein
MKQLKNFGLVVSLLMASGALVTAYRESQVILVLRAHLAADEAKFAASRRADGDATRRAREADGASKQLQRLLADSDPKAPPAAAGAVRASDLVAKWLALNNDPDVMRLLNAEQRAQTARRYGSLYRQLGLTQKQSDDLTTLLVNKRQAAMDTAVANVESGGGLLDPAAYNSEVLAARNEITGQIQAFLGASGYAAYVAYDQGQGQVGVIAMLEQNLNNSDTPLTDAQTAQLQQALQANHIGHVSEKVLTQAGQFLSPQQVDALREIYQEQQVSAQRKSIQQGIMTSPP